MKILESNNAQLTNYEVYQHLIAQQRRYRERPLGRQSGPGNLATLRREVLNYLQIHPGPLSQKPLTYTDSSINELLKQLVPYQLSKGEVFMMFNLRPRTIAELNAIVEDMEIRFTGEQQQAMIDAVTEVLGKFPDKEDVNMEAQENEIEAAGAK